MPLKTTFDILDFWFDEATETVWFKKDLLFDRQIKEIFLDTYKLAAAVDLSESQNNPKKFLV
ncbi:DUF924 family protein [Myxosarcina sp. GI1]|uniref:DUF924 family protein n=1 Tax=Myxosarcina sp. GI1 TaxID=1541065 RepID=UPI00056CDDB0|nr:DUF924 family protein [Myxosarcina sp. GI1]